MGRGIGDELLGHGAQGKRVGAALIARALQSGRQGLDLGPGPPFESRCGDDVFHTDDASRRHDGDSVGYGCNLVACVGDVEDRQGKALMQGLQIRQDRRLAVRIQAGQGLIHQQQARLGQQGPGNGHSLPFAARQAGRTALNQAGDPHQVHNIVEPDCMRRRRPPAAEVQITPDRKVREQGAVLENQSDRPTVRRQEDGFVLPDFIANPHGALEPGEAGQGSDQGRLSAA